MNRYDEKQDLCFDIEVITETDAKLLEWHGGFNVDNCLKGTTLDSLKASCKKLGLQGYSSLNKRALYDRLIDSGYSFEDNYLDMLRKSAALRPETGRVAMIGYYKDGNVTMEEISDSLTESELILGLWKRYSSLPGSLIGFDINRYDLPMLIKRSMILNIPIPTDLISDFNWGRFSRTIDLKKLWQMGDSTVKGRCEQVAKVFGYKRSTFNDLGKEFYKHFATDKEKCRAYLYDDVMELYVIAKRMMQ